MPRVMFAPPDRMNLLGYILRALIEHNLGTPEGARVFRKMKGSILVGASSMRVTLDFTSGDLVLSVGQSGKPNARVRGSLDTLLGVALGRGMVGPVLTGRLKVGGRFWRLLPMLKLMKAQGAS